MNENTAYYHIVPKGNRVHSVDMGAHCFCEPTPYRMKGAPGLRVCIHQGVTSERADREMVKLIHELEMD